MKGINGDAVIKAVEIIKEIQATGKLKKYHVTQSEFWEFCELVRELYNQGKGETIREAVKNLCEKCGFTCVSCGIGWDVNGIK